MIDELYLVPRRRERRGRSGGQPRGTVADNALSGQLFERPPAAGRVRPGGQPVVIVMRSHLVASGDDAADKVRAVEGKIGRRVKRGPQLQPREQVQQELQPLGS